MEKSWKFLILEVLLAYEVNHLFLDNALFQMDVILLSVSNVRVILHYVNFQEASEPYNRRDFGLWHHPYVD